MSEIKQSCLIFRREIKKPPGARTLDGLVQPKFLGWEMVHANNSKKESSTASSKLPNDNNATLMLHSPLDGEVLLQLPLWYTGGDLGLTGNAEPSIDFADDNGRRFYDLPFEWVLRHLDCFEEQQEQFRLLTDVAIHFGLGVHTLMGADLGNIHSRDSKDDWRHEGPLTLLHHSLGVTTFTGIAVRSHAGRCGMTLEEVLWRFDQFGAADQAELMAGLAKHFDLGQVQRETAGAA